MASHHETTDFKQQNPETDETDDIDEGAADAAEKKADDVTRRQQQRLELQLQQVLAQQLKQQPAKWDAEHNTICVATDSYGRIFFDGFGQEASRKAPVSVGVIYPTLC